MMERLICLCIGYVFGLFQAGYIIGKIKKIDIREYGSKNAGATNVLRTLGTKYGILVLLLDAAKCLLSVFTCRMIFEDRCPEIICMLMLYGAVGVILGHNFPFYLNFKGGKGIAPTLGFGISYCFQFEKGFSVFVIAFSVFVIVFLASHYVSLGSIMAYCSMFVVIVTLGVMGCMNFPVESNMRLLAEYFGVVLFLTVMAVYRHKENIKRLRNGCERKTYLKSKPELNNQEVK